MRRLVCLVSLLAVTSLVALSTVACAQDEPVAEPFPVAGYERDVTNLTGEWVGGYEGSRRRGIIAFQLTTRQDTARGYVVMIPQATDGRPPRPVTLSVHFVWVDATHVEGRMDRYADPDLGIELETTFYGRVMDGRLTGSFESVGTDMDTTLQTGWWWAQPKTGL